MREHVVVTTDQHDLIAQQRAIAQIAADGGWRRQADIGATFQDCAMHRGAHVLPDLNAHRGLAFAKAHDRARQQQGGDRGEGGDAHYALQFVVRADRKDDPEIAKFIAIYRSPEVKDYIAKKYGKFFVPVW